MKAHLGENCANASGWRSQGQVVYERLFGERIALTGDTTVTIDGRICLGSSLDEAISMLSSLADVTLCHYGMGVIDASRSFSGLSEAGFNFVTSAQGH